MKPSLTKSLRGLTFAELVIGMLVTTLVMGAVAALMTAVSHGWRHSEQVQHVSTASSQLITRVQRVVSNAKQLGKCRAGSLDAPITQPAAVMLWNSDDNDDGKIQFSELAVLEHSPDDRTLLLWTVRFPQNWTQQQREDADTTLADDCIYEADAIEQFKAMNYVSSTILARGITGAEFVRVDDVTKSRPFLDFRLKLEHDGVTELRYGVSAVRSAAPVPATQQ